MVVKEKVERAPRAVKMHIYVVNINGEMKLVRTTSRSKAIKHIVMPVESHIATQDELVDLLGQQIAVEEPE